MVRSNLSEAKVLDESSHPLRREIAEMEPSRYMSSQAERLLELLRCKHLKNIPFRLNKAIGALYKGHEKQIQAFTCIKYV